MIPKFHCTPGTISAATAILMEETGFVHEQVRVDFAAAAQTSAAYLAVNPKGRVPALATGEGVLTETGALLEYVAAHAPQAGLVPTEPWAAARMRAAAYYLASTVHVNHAHRMRGARWATEQSSFDDMAAKVPETMAQSCAFMESEWDLAPFVIGAQMTIADPWLFTVCTWLAGDGVDIRAYPKLAAHFDMMGARPSVARVRESGLLG